MKKRLLLQAIKAGKKDLIQHSWINPIEANKKVDDRIAWKSFRELTKRKWSSAFVEVVEDATSENKFTYVIAVTKLTGDKTDKNLWAHNSNF